VEGVGGKEKRRRFRRDRNKREETKVTESGITVQVPRNSRVESGQGVS